MFAGTVICEFFRG